MALMADSDRWAKLATEFRCLWDPMDPNFSTQRGQSYDQFLSRYNSVASIPDDLVTLKLKLAAYQKLMTGYTAKSVCMECLIKSKDIAMLLPEFPCLWDPLDLNFKDEAVRVCCLEQLLEQYNGQDGVTRVTMDQLTDKLNNFQNNRQQCSCTSDTAKIAGSSHNSTPQQGTEPAQQDTENVEMQKSNKFYMLDTDWARLLEQFPCLWNSQDLNFRDQTIMARSREELLTRYNNMSMIPISMQDLKRKLKNCRQRLRRQGPSIAGSSHNSTPQQGTEPAQQDTENAEMQKSNKFYMLDTDWARLLEQFPCLWNSQDLNFRDRTIMACSREELLTRYNNMSMIPISMQDLKRKLRTCRQRLRRHGPSISGSSPNTLQQGSKPAQQDTENVEMQKSNKFYMLDTDWARLLEQFPCLWNSNDLNSRDRTIMARSREELLTRYNNMSIIPISMEDLKRKLRTCRQRLRRHGPSMAPQSTPKAPKSLKQLLEEFPCLWNPQDMNFSDVTLRARAREQLLQKFNAESSVQIDMNQLKRKLKAMAHQRYRQGVKSVPKRGTRLAEFMKEFPCLWDPQDLNFNGGKVKARAREQLLQKFNAESSVQIDMKELKRKLKAMALQRYRKRAEADQKSVSLMEELVQEFPCLWDPEDLNYNDCMIRARAREQLLRKYNSTSSIPINMVELKRKLFALDQRRRRKSQMQMTKRGDSAAQATESGSIDVIASLHAINSQNLRDSNDSRGSFDSTEPLTLVSSEEVEVVEAGDESQEPIHETPQCRVCGALDENCISINNDTPYVAGNTTALTLNNLHVTLDFNTSKTVCQNCDNKLKEIFDFVTLVKNSQENLNIDASNIKTEIKQESALVDDDGEVYATEIDSVDEIDLKDLDLEAISVTDTEFIKQTVNAYLEKNKEVEIPRPRKKRRVYVDLNTCSLSFSNNDDQNDDKTNLILTDSHDDTDTDITKENLFTDKNTGVIIEVLKRVSKKTYGNSGEVIDIIRPDIENAGNSDDRPQKKAKLKDVGGVK